MYKIKTMNHISPCGLQKLEERGCVVGENIQDPDGLILRSADLHSYAFEPSLIAIARSGAGTNNIPLEDCCRRGQLYGDYMQLPPENKRISHDFNVYMKENKE